VRLGFFTACLVDAANLGGQEAERVRELFDRHRLELTSLGCYDNPLHPDPAVRRATSEHLRACIDAAATLGCPTVGTFIGRDPGRTVAENLRDAETVFAPLVEHAGERGVKVIIENCPMEGEVDWWRLVDAMYEGGFDGTLSVEHEDPVWGGDTDRVKAGLEIAHRTLRPLLVR
jgi:sugar phosphate isomerase/epimerase